MKYCIKNNRSEIQPMVGKIVKSCCEQCLSDEVIQDLRLVLEEMLTNTIKYAYDDDQEHEIAVEINIDAESLQFRLEDDGKPFNPTQHYNPDIDKDFDDRQIGGMGIHLVKSLMDEVEYEYRQGRNILVVKKKLH